MIALALPGARPAPDRRRQPRRAADDRGHARACTCWRRRSGRARSRRTRSSSTRTAPGGAARRPSRGAAPARRAAAARPGRSCRRRSLAPVLRAAAPVRAPGEPRRRARAACCRSAPPGARDSGDAAGDRPRAPDPRPLHPGRGLPGGDRRAADRRARRSASTSSTSAYSAFPWLVLAVLVVSYLLLLRAFRSVVLPVKAVVMNLLSVSATYGVLVLVFEHGWGTRARPAGLAADRRLDPDLPVRDAVRALDGLRGVPALAHARGVGAGATTTSAASPTGSSTPGRIITAAAVIMIAAFAGFVAGSFVGLQEFGLGLSAAILARRDGRARDARPRDDEAARALELVPARARAPRAAAAAPRGFGLTCVSESAKPPSSTVIAHGRPRRWEGSAHEAMDGRRRRDGGGRDLDRARGPGGRSADAAGADAADGRRPARPLDVEGAPQFGWMPGSARGDDVQTRLPDRGQRRRRPPGVGQRQGRLRPTQSYVALRRPGAGRRRELHVDRPHLGPRRPGLAVRARPASFDTGLTDSSWSGAQWIRRVTTGNDSTDDYTLARKQFSVGAQSGHAGPRVRLGAWASTSCTSTGRTSYRGDSFDYPGEGQYTAVDITQRRHRRAAARARRPLPLLDLHLPGPRERPGVEHDAVRRLGAPARRT